MMKEAILDLFKFSPNNMFGESIGIADLGCSSGPNTLLVVSEILNVIYAKWQQLGRPSSPEFRVYLNDLTGNDFNNVFSSLPAFYNKLKEEKRSEFGPCFISGVPGSFYGRIFPTRSLHFVHSSSSLHWLSQVCSFLCLFLVYILPLDDNPYQKHIIMHHTIRSTHVYIIDFGTGIKGFHGFKPHLINLKKPIII